MKRNIDGTIYREIYLREEKGSTTFKISEVISILEKAKLFLLLEVEE